MMGRSEAACAASALAPGADGCGGGGGATSRGLSALVCPPAGMRRVHHEKARASLNTHQASNGYPSRAVQSRGGPFLSLLENAVNSCQCPWRAPDVPHRQMLKLPPYWWVLPFQASLGGRIAPALAMMFPEAVRERGRVCSGSSAGFPPRPAARSRDGGLRSTAVGASDSATSSCVHADRHHIFSHRSSMHTRTTAGLWTVHKNPCS